MLRLIALVVALLLALPASAQSRFYAQCLTASEGEDAVPVEIATALCGCTVQRALAGGHTAEDLDRYAAFSEGRPLQLVPDDEVPEAVQATAKEVPLHMIGCVGEIRAAYEAGTLSLGASDTTRTAPRPHATRGRGRPGTARVGTRQGGAGAAIRIVD